MSNADGADREMTGHQRQHEEQEQAISLIKHGYRDASGKWHVPGPGDYGVLGERVHASHSHPESHLDLFHVPKDDRGKLPPREAITHEPIPPEAIPPEAPPSVQY